MASSFLVRARGVKDEVLGLGIEWLFMMRFLSFV